MELCTNLQTRVLGLEKTKTTQSNEIASLKRRVKKLENRNRSRTHKLKRLYKVGLTARVESYANEESLGEDASKQGSIEVIDADEDITLVNIQDDAEMFDVDDLGGEEVFVAKQEVVKDVNANVVEEVVNDAQNSTATTTITTKEITLAQALAALKTSKPRKRRKHFAAKRAEDKRNKPPTQAQKRKIICTYLKNMKGYKLTDLKLKEFDFIKEMFNRAFRRVNTFVDYKTQLIKGIEKRVREELIQKSINKQKVVDEKEKDDLKQLMETILDEEEVAIYAIPLAVKSPRIVD
nr:hypothetical protein [Tanacetum cinerariifolium]